MIKFSEMPYERPDLDEVFKAVSEVTEQLEKAADYASAREAFLSHESLSKHIQTLSTLAQVRYSINTKDDFYQAEDDFWNRSMPLIEEKEHAWTAAMLRSPFRADFAAEYGDLMFINAEMEFKAFSPEIIPELQQENDLVQEYETLLAKSEIPFEGKIFTISQIGAIKNDADDERRLAAWKAEGKWYKDHQEKLDEIYDELVHLRDTMGKKLGFDGYTPLGYLRMTRNCYTKEDIEVFRKAVVKYLVPVADRIFRVQAKRLGKEYPMSFADNALSFRSGNPKPAGDADEIVAAARRFYDDLSPETSEFFRTMIDGELMSLLATEGKRGGGYCTELGEYKVPFIFANFNGTSDDVETVTHEAGHAFASYINIDRIPMTTIWPSMEACEVHSMSMEFFSWLHAEDFFGDDTRKFKYSHLAGALKFIPYGTMVDHFQHLVFENPDWTPRRRHDCWKELLGIYMPWMRLDGDIPFYADGEGWQRQHHIYSFPFYYIDYCFAQIVALGFWDKIQADPAKAWDYYMKYTRQGGSRTFTDLLKNAGLESPFDESYIQRICADADKWLSAYDLTGIK